MEKFWNVGVRTTISEAKELSANFSYAASDKTYGFTLPWEENFDYERAVPWIEEVYGDRMWLFALGYVLMVFLGRKAMENRPPVPLSTSLQVWNAALAIFSMLGTWRVMPELYTVVKEDGFYSSVCIPSYLFRSNVTAFWMTLFVVSKLAEFGDTAFLIVRKRPVIFLHWYHHVSVLFFAFQIWDNAMGAGRWFASLNFAVHSVMYSYYFLRSVHVRVPTSVSMTITAMQILQMVVGCFCVAAAVSYRRAGRPCSMSWNDSVMAGGLYLSYFVLFGKFFRDAYLVKKPKTKAQ